MTSLQRLRETVNAIAADLERIEAFYGDNPSMPISERRRFEELNERLERIRGALRIGCKLFDEREAS